MNKNEMVSVLVYHPVIPQIMRIIQMKNDGIQK